MRRNVAAATTSDQAIAAYRRVLKRQTIARAIRMRPIYLLLLLSMTLLVVFKYGPIYGLIIAFKDYNFYDGALGSPWNDFAHFKRLFKDPFFLRVFFNTFWLSVLRLVFGFPCPIILALLLNEVRVSLYRRVVQTISYLPHFISWVILAGILTEVLSPQRGIIAHFYTLLGMEPVHWLTNKATFRGLLVVTGIWQGIGWSSIVYLAALSSIDPRALRERVDRRSEPLAENAQHYAPFPDPRDDDSVPDPDRQHPGRVVRADIQPLQPAGVFRG